MEVTWLPFAQNQLKAVMQYVRDNFGENIARKSFREIMRRVDELRNFPDIGILDRQFSAKEVMVRHLNIGPNVVYYIEDLNEIVVIAVMHHKQSPSTINRTIIYALGLND